MEFCKLVAEKGKVSEEVTLHLINVNSEDYLENGKEAFKEMIDSLGPIGVKLSFEFSDTQQNR